MSWYQHMFSKYEIKEKSILDKDKFVVENVKFVQYTEEDVSFEEINEHDFKLFFQEGAEWKMTLERVKK